MTKHQLLKEEGQCSIQVIMLRQEDQGYKVNLGYAADSCIEKGKDRRCSSVAEHFPSRPKGSVCRAGMKDTQNQIKKFDDNTASIL